MVRQKKICINLYKGFCGKMAMFIPSYYLNVWLYEKTNIN